MKKGICLVLWLIIFALYIAYYKNSLPKTVENSSQVVISYTLAVILPY